MKLSIFGLVPIILIAIAVFLTIMYSFFQKIYYQKIGLWFLGGASVYWLFLIFFEEKKYLIDVYERFGFLNIFFLSIYILLSIIFSFLWIKKEKPFWLIIFMFFILCSFYVLIKN